MKYIYIAFISLGFLFACSSVKINVDSDGDTEYIKFETYGWLNTGKQVASYKRIDNKELESLIDELINRMMTEKGYEFIEDGDPDILITFYAGVTGEVVTDDAGYTYGKWFEGAKEFSQKGLLLIDLIDNENRVLFWRGKGSGLFDDPENAGEAVQKICREIFSDFPDRSMD
jgi:hypothetical protein